MATSQGDFTAAFPRLLVEPQSLESRMAQAAVRAPFAKGHLGDERRLDPVDLSTMRKHPFLEWRPCLLKVRELPAKFTQRLVRKPRAHLAGIVQRCTVVAEIADQ